MQKSYRFFFLLILVCSMLVVALQAVAQSVDFESQLNQRKVNCILEQGDTVLGGLDGGGVLIWDRQDPTQRRRLSAGEELSGNLVTAMTWTGRYIWIATSGGGMTRINNLDTDPEFRQYASNLGSLDITAVTGKIIGDNERVYYGMNEGGIGLITDGISGAIYTAEQDGLINNNINDLQFLEDVLFVATPMGISRFANNVFTDQNTGLGNLDVTDLEVDSLGRLVAGGPGGVFVWDQESETWSNLNWTGNCRGLSSGDNGLWILGWNVASEYDGENWTGHSLPLEGSNAIFVGQNTWVGGRWRGPEMGNSSALAWYGAFDDAYTFADHVVEASLIANGYGLDFDHEGTVWTGSYVGQALSGVGADHVQNISQLATADNDSSGLFAYGSNMLALVADHERGLVYTGQYTKGIIRHDINTGELDLMYGGTCGLEETPYADSRIVALETHPDGTLIVMYDWAHEQKVRILTDPVHWRGDHWYDVPQGGDEGIGNGIGVWDALVVRNDVIWFAVEGTGLVRWDINGNSAGPDDPLTWNDFSDDDWKGPYSSIDGTSNDPTQAKTRLALAPDGSIWFGGNGLTRFTYEDVFGTVKTVEDFSTRTASFQVGLIDGNVGDLEVDANGDLWVSTRAGLNCVRWGNGETEIDAFFDLANYFSNSSYALLYSPNVITSLPGGVYTQVASSADGKRMAVTSNRGTVAWDIGAGLGETEASLSSLYCYPNPFTPGGVDSKLALGGISADYANDDPAFVEIYNLAGELVYKNSYVSAEEGFWSGANRVGEPVATGLYVVKTTWRGLTAVRTLAIVR